ncbi:Uncharacterised protein [Providencia rustigianii]|nr:Uncharacterised protein [Providencia rustigianii]
MYELDKRKKEPHHQCAAHFHYLFDLLVIGLRRKPLLTCLL